MNCKRMENSGVKWVLWGVWMYTLIGFQSLLAVDIPQWAQSGRVAGFSIQSNADDLAIEAGITRLKNQNVSIVELDTSLSKYWTDEEFQTEVDFIGRVATEIHNQGMKVVVYYPALEVVTPDGEILPRSAAKDHPDWLQIGINGQSNVFYGSQEDWVPPQGESAWMSPNTGYKDYFIGRVKKLANETGVDGLWMDVPLYLDTGAPWSDMGPAAKAAFEQWSQEQGHNGGAGFDLPTEANVNNLDFRMWLEWRHINLAEFIDEVRVESLAVNPNWMLVTEVYPMDYLDTLWTGLDGARLKKEDRFLKVWEVDSVSNGQAMKYASVEDFSNRIAMYKYARGVDRDVPSWGFTYGFEVEDAALGIGAAIATQTIPFETKTPIMTETVDSDMRAQWYGFIKDREESLFKTDRLSRVGVWFSSATREYYDYANGGKYGMFLQEDPPAPDPDWWAQFEGASLRKLPHVSAWRGAAHGLHQLGISYKCVVDPTESTDLDNLEVLWMPSVVCLSDAKANQIEAFVQAGGTLIATGVLPGTQDEFGNQRPQSVLDSLFEFGGALTSGPRMIEFGSGVVIYRPDIIASDLFSLEGGNAALADSTLGKLEQLLRIHTTDDIVADLPQGIFLELSEITAANKQFLYALNFSGAQQPMVIAPKSLQLQYKIPEGFKVENISLSSPEAAPENQDASIPFAYTNTQYVGFEVTIEQFALITIELSPDSSTPLANTQDLVYDSPEIEEAVVSGIQFILDTMRNATGQTQAPYKYGVPTNLIDNNFSTTVYTGGHHVTAEHMGLLLRVTALMKHQQGFNESVEFVQDVLFSKGYHVPGWSMDKTRLKRFLQPDQLNNQDVWLTANAPLDDFRVVRGLLQGAERMSNPNAQNLAETILNGMYWTSVTDRLRGVAPQFPLYPDGLIGYSWDWADQDVPGLDPLAEATGLGRLGTFPIPVDYQELETMALAASVQPRWKPTLASSVDLLLNSEIPDAPGLFFNGLSENNTFTGDFEFPGERQGNNLKTIQELWILLHLKRVSNSPAYILDLERRQAAAEAAQRGYDFFKAFYLQNQRVPEYLTFAGDDVPECGPTIEGDCLSRGTENLFNGEARIYAQLGRLALLMNDRTFALQLINEKILTDREGDTQDPRYGMIGLSTTGANDAEAWNTLEPLLTMCLASLPAPTGQGSNTNPSANPDTIGTGINARRLIPHTSLLGNDTDAENQILAVLSVDSQSAQGGSVELTTSHVSYIPPQDFEGQDTFSYTIADTEGGTSSAVVTMDVSSQIVIPVGITLDGDLLDWPQEHIVVSDPADIQTAGALTDLRELHVHHEEGKLYIAYVNDSPIQLNWGFNLFIDADQNSSTGYQYYELGADYVINDKTVQGYQGNGSDWSWSYVGDIKLRIKDNTAEFSFPLNGLGNPQTVYLAFEGSNEPYGFASEVDYVPDTITQSGQGLPYIVYRIEIPDGILADGELEDWTGNVISFSDPKESSQPNDSIDLRTIQFTSDDSNFYIAYENENPIQLNWGYQLLIDTDNNPATGFAFYEFGADYIIYDGGAFQYQGNGSDWNWGFLGNPSTGIKDNILEMGIPKAWLGSPNSFRFVFVGDNEANGGTLVDIVPDGAVILNTEPSNYLVEFDNSTPPNQAPTAQNDSAVVEFGQAVLVSVLANDSDSDGTLDASSVEIVNAPTVGGVTVTPQGDIVYQHDNTLQGQYSFSYRVADDQGLFSSAASVQITVNPPVISAPFNPVVDRTLDGSLDEWNDVQPIGLDPKDASEPGDELDWKTLYLAHNNQSLFIAYESWQPIILNWGHNIYLDTDLSSTTGMKYGEIGADFLLQQGSLFQYAGDGYSWAWNFIEQVPQAFAGNVVELAVPRNSISNPNMIRAIWYGENQAYTNGTTLDIFPDNGTATEYNFVASGENQAPVGQNQSLTTLKDRPLDITLSATDPEGVTLQYSIESAPGNGLLSGTLPNITYTPSEGYVGQDSFSWSATDGELSTGSQTVQIEILPQPDNGYPSYPISQFSLDGVFSEWAGLTSVGVDPADATIANQESLDFRELWLAHTTDSLLMAMRSEQPATLNWAYNIFMDSDLSESTGYVVNGTGADYLMQGQFLFRYEGDGNGWDWQFISAVAHAVDGVNHEWKIPSTLIQSPEKLHIVLNADNVAYGSGVQADYLPDESFGQGQSYVRYQMITSTPGQTQKSTLEAIDIRRTQPFVIHVLPFIPVAQSDSGQTQTLLKTIDLYLKALPGDVWNMEYSTNLGEWYNGGALQLDNFDQIWAPTLFLDESSLFFRAIHSGDSSDPTR